MTTALVTGADARYGFHLLNLIGSVQRNSDIFDRIVAYDLGLDDEQRRLLEGIRGVEHATVPPFVPHYLAGGTYKTWIWTHLDADVIFWVDAGATVLRSLEEPLQQVRARGYFVVSQGHPVRPTIPSDYYALYDIPPELPDRDIVAGGIHAWAKGGDFYEKVVVPTYEDNLRGRNLGFSAEEVEKLNRGINKQDPPIIRDCPMFRPGQTVWSIHFYKNIRDPVVNDLTKYAGFRTPHDHPEQLIWSHRRRGNYAYLGRARYDLRTRPLALRVAARLRYSLWTHANRRYLQPRAYARKVVSVLGRSAARG